MKWEPYDLSSEHANTGLMGTVGTFVGWHIDHVEIMRVQSTEDKTQQVVMVVM